MHEMNSQRTPLFVYLIIIFLPFLLLYWMIPFITNMTIWGDHIDFELRPQMELFFSIKTGSFPLYVPGFASGGHSSSALMQGQVFHPISHLSSIMPGYWNGRAIEWNNFFMLLSLGLTQLVLFVFLKKMKLNTPFSFILSFITVYNLRMMREFWFGAPLQAYTGHLILCSAIGWYFIDSKKWFGPLSIIIMTYLLVCSGQPPEMYYGLLAAVLFTLIAPSFLSTMLPDRKVGFKIILRFWLRVGFFLCLGVLLSSAYILPLYFDFISDNIHRIGRDYAWAGSKTNIMRALNNFFLPLSSNIYQGAFGGSSLILAAAILPLLRLFKVKIPASVWVIWGLFLIVFLHMQGSRTPVHRLMWEYLPFASSIREAERISTIMPFFIMLLLAWIIRADTISIKSFRLFKDIKPSAILASITGLLIAIYYLSYFLGYYIFKSPIILKLFLPYYADITFILFNYYFTYFNVEFFYVYLGLISLVALIFYGMHVNAKPTKILATILVITTFLLFGFVLRHSAVMLVLISLISLIFYGLYINTKPTKI